MIKNENLTEKNDLNIFIDGLGSGGAENLLSQLLPLLKPKFSNIYIHCLNNKFSMEKIFESEFSIFKHSSLGLFREIFKTKSLSYFHLGRCSLFAFLVLFIRNILGTKNNFIVHIHTTIQFHYLETKSFMRRVIDKIYLFFFKNSLKNGYCKFILSSDDHLRELNKFCGRNLILDSEVFILPNSFTKDRINSLKNSRMNINSNKLLVNNQISFFTLSRLDPLKQIDWAIYSTYETAKDFPNMKIILKIFGRGPENLKLQKIIAELPLISNFRVELCGFIEDTIDPITSSDVYLFPSKLEGSPLSLAEVALSGIKCISNDCQNGPKYLTNYFPNIYLVTPPLKENFILSVKKITDYLQNNSLATNTNHNIISLKEWPSLESLSDDLGNFLIKPS